MPQFDFTTYSAQIFWFSICFFVLYYFMAKIILPRIRKIIADRKNVIADDISTTNALNQQNDEVSLKIKNVLLEADIKYKASIDEAVRNAAKNKEKSLEEFKTLAEKLIQKSQIEVDKIKQEADRNNLDFINRISLLIQSKLFNS